MSDDDDSTVTDTELRELAVSLITAILHEDDEAVDYLLLNLGVWRARALALVLGDYLAEQVRWTARCDGLDATVAWSTALAAVKGHPSGGGSGA